MFEPRHSPIVANIGLKLREQVRLKRLVVVGIRLESDIFTTCSYDKAEAFAMPSEEFKELPPLESRKIEQTKLGSSIRITRLEAKIIRDLLQLRWSCKLDDPRNVEYSYWHIRKWQPPKPEYKSLLLKHTKRRRTVSDTPDWAIRLGEDLGCDPDVLSGNLD